MAAQNGDVYASTVRYARAARREAKRLWRFAVEEKSNVVGRVRLATLNLWGRHGSWDERRSVLVDGLRELRPDIVAFQEAVVNDGYDQVADLLGAGYHLAHQAGRLADGTGLSIASRWPLGEVWEEALRVTPRADPSQMAVAEILVPSPLGTTLLFAHHNAA